MTRTVSEERERGTAPHGIIGENQSGRREEAFGAMV